MKMSPSAQSESRQEAGKFFGFHITVYYYSSTMNVCNEQNLEFDLCYLLESSIVWEFF